ncbi:MAG: hypothetical protein AAGG11_07615 [Pseudomonadota bacterium]
MSDWINGAKSVTLNLDTPSKKHDGTLRLRGALFQVKSADAYASTEVFGGGGTVTTTMTAYGGYTTGSISSVSSRTTHHQKLVIAGQDGREETLSLDGSPIQFREGAVVARMFLSAGGQEAPYALYSVEQDSAITDEQISDDMVHRALGRVPFSLPAWMVVPFGAVVGVFVGLATALLVLSLLVTGLIDTWEVIPKSAFYDMDTEMGDVYPHWIVAMAATMILLPLGGGLFGWFRAQRRHGLGARNKAITRSAHEEAHAAIQSLLAEASAEARVWRETLST